MSRPLPKPAAPRAACPGQPRPNQPRPGHGCPASRLYTLLRHGKGLSHEEATQRLREALKRYFRAA